MKKRIIKLVSAFLLTVLMLTTVGCNSNKNEYSSVRESCVVGEKKFFFIDDAAKQGWIEPLSKLLSNELIPYGEKGDILGYKASIDPKLPVLPQNLRCGLLDVTNDGTPELLIQPFGAFGSSGTATYFAYNIYNGQKIGELEDGMGDSWGFYYNTKGDCLELCCQYWHRIGAFGYEYYMHKSSYDDAYMENYDIQCLHASYSIHPYTYDSDVVYIKPTKNSLYDDSFIENCIEINYYVNSEAVEAEEYFAKCDEISSALIKIPETALVLIAWSDVSDDGDDFALRAEKMARALVNTEQKFIIP